MTPPYLNVIFVVAFDNSVVIELVIVVNGLATFLCPLYILLSSPIIVEVVHQAQYHMHTMISSFWDYKV